MKLTPKILRGVGIGILGAAVAVLGLMIVWAVVTDILSAEATWLTTFPEVLIPIGVAIGAFFVVGILDYTGALVVHEEPKRKGLKVSPSGCGAPQ